MSDHDHHHERAALTRNQREIMDCLQGERKPLSAYQILDRVRAAGISHPPTVYRALNDLIRLGLAHRIESMGSFVACDHDAPVAGEHRAGFAICRVCERVTELDLTDKKGRAKLDALAPDAFAVESVSLEFSGLCAACAAGVEPSPGAEQRPA